MKVHQVPVGSMQNFTYVVEDKETGQAIIIDPSWDLVEIELVIKRRNLQVIYIVNTHHHVDHTLGNKSMAKSTGAKIVQHKASDLTCDITVDDGDTVEFGNSKLKVLYTPGHSKDGICLVGDGKIFTGDTLFVGSCGRVDLPGGDPAELYHSLFDVLYTLDDGLVVYPGHDYGSLPTSTIGDEKATNPVLQKRTKQEFVSMMSR